MSGSTTADSSGCSVHRVRPFGGAEQAMFSYGSAFILSKIWLTLTVFVV